MRSYFSPKPQFWLGGIVLLALVMIVPVAPAMAVPLTYSLSGPVLTGIVTIDDTLILGPFTAWDLFEGGTHWTFANGGFANDTVLQNVSISGPVGPGNFYLVTVESTFGNTLNFQAFTDSPLGCPGQPFNNCYSAAFSDADGNGLVERGFFFPPTVSSVPEPSIILLLATGLLSLAGARWWQHRQERTQVG